MTYATEKKMSSYQQPTEFDIRCLNMKGPCPYPSIPSYSFGKFVYIGYLSVMSSKSWVIIMGLYDFFLILQRKSPLDVVDYVLDFKLILSEFEFPTQYSLSI